MHFSKILNYLNCFLAGINFILGNMAIASLLLVVGIHGIYVDAQDSKRKEENK